MMKVGNGFHSQKNLPRSKMDKDVIVKVQISLAGEPGRLIYTKGSRHICQEYGQFKGPAKEFRYADLTIKKDGTVKFVLKGKAPNQDW